MFYLGRQYNMKCQALSSLKKKKKKKKNNRMLSAAVVQSSDFINTLRLTGVLRVFKKSYKLNSLFVSTDLWVFTNLL